MTFTLAPQPHQPMDNLNVALYRAYRDGVADRTDNPASYDEDASSYFIYDEFRRGQSDRSLYVRSSGDASLILAECAEWGRHDRDAVTSFLLR